MEIMPTKELRAKRNGDMISVELQKGVSLTLTLDQGIFLYQGVQRQVVAMLNDTAQREPEGAKLIAFPVHETRRASV